ncbi:MAG: HD domain-containing protein, partial [Chloroflexi bacterium]|nr:HD domain-containing protein [Chloroflexota bacterium]
MVTVTQRPSEAVATARPELEPALAGLEAAERALVERAAALAGPLYDGKLLGTGEPALDHAYGLAANLAQLRVDAATRAAGMLFAAPEYLPNAADELAARTDAA